MHKNSSTQEYTTAKQFQFANVIECIQAQGIAKNRELKGLQRHEDMKDFNKCNFSDCILCQ